MNKDLPINVPDNETGLMEHARELVDVVHERGPGQYRKLLESPRFTALLETQQAFNHGKLFVYAEYCVFRKEFTRRFPEATAHACINAFSRLLLKNDISITNLVTALEGATGAEQALLQQDKYRD